MHLLIIVALSSQLLLLAMVADGAVLRTAAKLARRPELTELPSYRFEDYERDFGKTYATPEERTHRAALFAAALARVRAHNALTGSSYTANVNHMSDWTPEEFQAVLGGRPALRGQGVPPHAAAPAPKQHGDRALPTRVDWREHVPSVVTPVKNQLSCGSCWAFAATATMESHWALHTGREAPILSTQQVTSCTPNPDRCGGRGGCEGATAELAFGSVIKVGGIVSEADYPYKAETGTCKIPNPPHFVANFSRFVVLPMNDQRAVMEALATHGPLSVNVWASPMKDYYTGVFDGCSYSENIRINHVVQLVGYGTDTALGKDYWIVRNSWSASWGEDGYIRLQRDPGDTPRCGIDWTPTQGTACETEPSLAWRACGMCGLLTVTSYPVV